MRLRFQARACERLGSALYSELLERAAVDVERGGPAYALLAGHEADPPESALALRLMGAVHQLVLQRRVPDLARHYPSVGGRPGDAWPAFREALSQHREQLSRLLDRPVQTNEIGRCAALLPAFLVIARESALPLRLLEVGASAGLNLRFDHYRYEAGRQNWGPVDSPVRIRWRFEGRRPSLAGSINVVERAGCDINPLDATSNEGALTLRSFVWADQPDRAALLDGAVEMARSVPVQLERARADAWLSRMLTDPKPGAATVIYHSIVAQYLSDRERDLLPQLIANAGQRAEQQAPLYWLQMEPAGKRANITLTSWPDGQQCRLARAGYHGNPVRWLAHQSRPSDHNHNDRESHLHKRTDSP